MEWLVGFLAIIGIILIVSILFFVLGFLFCTEEGNEILGSLFILSLFISAAIFIVYLFTVKAYQFGEFLLHGQ